MGKTWYSYPSLLRKQSTSTLDCLTSIVCAGMMVGGANPVVTYWAPRNGRPALVSLNYLVYYLFIPLANSKGVYIRGDSCDARTGTFDNSYRSTNRIGEYWIRTVGTDVCPATRQTSRLIRYPRSRTCEEYDGPKPEANENYNSGRFSFDFDTMTATFDARIDANLWAGFIDSSVNNSNAPAKVFPSDYPNQSVDLSDLDASGNPGFVFSYTFPGPKTADQDATAREFFNPYDEDENLKYWSDDPIASPLFTIPFRRSNS